MFHLRIITTNNFAIIFLLISEIFSVFVFHF